MTQASGPMPAGSPDVMMIRGVYTYVLISAASRDTTRACITS